MQIENIYILLFFILINIILYYNLNLISKSINIFDQPDKSRKFHKDKVPLIGGIFIAINILFYLKISLFFENIFPSDNFYFQEFTDYISVYFILAVLLFLGICDDLYDLSAHYKMSFLFIIIFFTVVLDTELQIKDIRLEAFNTIYLSYFSLPFSIICLLLFINAFNMFDGINMQCSSYALICFIFFYISNILPSFSFIIIISLIFFLYNNYSSKIFLGDSGTIMISYLIGIIFIKSYNNNQIENVETIFIIMMIPGYDMLRLFFLRIYNRKNPFKGDRNHLHHLIGDVLGKDKAFYVTQVLILIPIILAIFISKIILIVLFTLIYTLLIIYLSNKRNSLIN